MVEFKDGFLPDIKKGGLPTFDKFGPTIKKSSHWTSTKGKKKGGKMKIPKAKITLAEIRTMLMFIFLGIFIFMSTIILYSKIFPDGSEYNYQYDSQGVIKELTYIGQAHDKYVKDTKIFLPLEKAKSLKRKASSLIKNIADVKNWNGPYLEGYTDDTNGTIKGESALDLRNGLSNISIGYYSINMKRCKKNDCYVWISMSVPHSYKNTLRDIDQKLDGQLSRYSGRFIYKKLKNHYFVAYAHAKK